MITFGRKRCKQ